MISPIAPPEEHVSLRGPRGEYPSSPSRRRRSMCRSGGQEVSIFFPVTPPEEDVSLRGSGGRYLLSPYAVGGACVAPGVGSRVGIFSPVTPPEEHVSLRGSGVG